MRTHWQISPNTTLKVNRGQPQVFELKTPTKSISLDLEDAIKLSRVLDEAITFIDADESIVEFITALDKAVSERANP